MKGNMTADNIVKFYNDWHDGNLSPILKSEPIPENNDELVKVIVGNTFDELVKYNPKDVLVEYYAPWCGFCKKVSI